MRFHRHLLAVALALFAIVSIGHAAVPAEFQLTTVAAGLSQPVALAAAPDGRVAVAERAAGRIRLIANGNLLAAPLLDLKQAVAGPAYFETSAEHGVLGLAFDPGFPASPYLYVYFSVCKTPASGYCESVKNRVARFTVGQQGDPNRADPGSQLVLLDDIDSDAGNHNAGWLGFGPLDGKLYVTVGDGGRSPEKAQSLESLNGKVLRIEPTGGVPFDNPFVGLFGVRAEIYALGLRNPWRCRFHPDGRLFCGDVGASLWEEIDWIVSGGNYGWPVTEGDFSAGMYPEFVRPVYVYPHFTNRTDGPFYGSSVTGGDFGSETNFPGDFQQSWFFADYGNKWIRRVVLGADGVTIVRNEPFATDMGSVTDLIAGADGALYLVDIDGGVVRRITGAGANHPPVARMAAVPAQGAAPLAVQFSSTGSSDPDGEALTYAWTFGDGTPGATGPTTSHTYVNPGLYTVRLTVSDGTGSDVVETPITVGTPPVVRIGQPTGAPFVGGQTIELAGSATDAEDGPLPASALRWEVRFHHADHWHPYVAELVGSPQGFVTATTGETAADVWYRVYLRATDSTGLTGEAWADVPPATVRMTIETQPAGLQVTLDGQPRPTPLVVEGVVGVVRTIGAPSPQGGYTFTAWSDGGVQVHTIATPAVDATYTAVFSGSGPTPTTVTTTTVTTTTTGVAASTTSTTAGAASTTTVSATTSTTLAASPGGDGTPPAPGCPGTGLAPIGCRLEEATAGLDSLALIGDARVRAAGRHLRAATVRVQRAAAQCASGRTGKARTMVRGAARRVERALGSLRRASGGLARSPDTAAQLATLAQDLRALRGGLSCP